MDVIEIGLHLHDGRAGPTAAKKPTTVTLTTGRNAARPD
jgi:hypothetical protein